MRDLRTAAFGLALLGMTAPGITAAWAQDAPAGAIAIPDGPLLREAPTFSAWTVSYTYLMDRQPPKDGEKPTPDVMFWPRSITKIKTGNILSEKTTLVNGNVTWKYAVGRQWYVKNKGDTVWGLSTDKWADFPELDWINATNYAGTIQYGDVTCLIFVKGGAQAADLSDKKNQEATLQKQPWVGYINAATRLPVAVRYPGETIIFRFDNPPPTTAQELPEDLTAQIEKLSEEIGRLNAPAPRPY